MLTILDYLLFMSTTSTSFFDDLDTAIARYFNSPSSLKLSAAVEKTFRGSNSIREVDSYKLSAIVAANRLCKCSPTLAVRLQAYLFGCSQTQSLLPFCNHSVDERETRDVVSSKLCYCYGTIDCVSVHYLWLLD